jgi:APA family basic amino acid/polyamine antiporter
MGGKVVALTILISVFSATNSVVLTAPRVFYAMAKDNLFFKTLAEVHPRFHTPANAIAALCVWSTVLTFAGKFSELASGVVFIGWIFYGLGAAAIFPFRAALGALTKALPYRVPGYPWTPIVFLLAAVAVVGNAIFLAKRDPQEFRHVLAGLIPLVMGIPAYFLWRWWNSRSVSSP